MKSIEVPFGKKFVSKNLQEILNKYWNKSFESDVVTFNLEELEWITNEELTFWYAWIYRLIDQKKFIRIYLQNGMNIHSGSREYYRRKRMLSSLVFKSGLNEKFHQTTYLNGHNQVDIIFRGMSASQDFLPTTEESLIPFYKIKANNYRSKNSSEEFEIEQKNMFTSYPIEQSISNNLKAENLNQLDNYALSYIIPKELYTNSCHHAYTSLDPEISRECYLTIGHESKISQNKSLDYLLKMREEEKTTQELNFYRYYKNTSYLTFSFLDFGEGIPSSLSERYNLDFADKKRFEKIGKLLSPEHEFQNLDTRILEYSLLLYTSRNELEENLEFHDFIPRGLYVIKDIVRRNGGLLIIRSGKGRITLDYSQTKSDLSKIIRYKENNDEVEFYGTLISIVLPSINQPLDPKTSRASLTLKPNYFKYQKISLLNLYLEAYYNSKSQTEFYNEHTVTKEIFKKISQFLLDLNNEGGQNNIMFDYGGIDLKKNDFARILFYYLILSPLINENNHAIIFNVANKKILETYRDLDQCLSDDTTKEIHNTSINSIEITFLKKPIPCILADTTVSFIGLDHNQLHDSICAIWKHSLAGEALQTSADSVDYHFTKNSSFDSQKRIIHKELNLPLLEDLYNEILVFNRMCIDMELANEGIIFKDLYYTDQDNQLHNYNNVLFTDERSRYYLTTNGKFQASFISFIEKLYKKQYRQLIATYLVYAFYHHCSNKLIKSDITKILTVTLSSQLLGKEVKEIFDSLTDNLDKKENKITLIPLSNYYDFEQEEPFKEINSGDVVLVVNDVISTGNLSDKIYKSINNPKINAKVAGLLTIVDSREDLTRYSDIKDLTVSLTSKPTPLLDSLPNNNVDLVWISPLVNAPITMKRNNSVSQNVLFSVEEFLAQIDVENILVIGHIKHNTLHHTYYLRASEIYKIDKQNDYKLFKKMFARIDEKMREKEGTKTIDKASFIQKNLETLHKDISNLQNIVSSGTGNNTNKLRGEIVNDIAGLNDKLTQLSKKFKNVSNNIGSLQSTPELYFNAPNFDIDFLFIPFLSSAMNIIDDLPHIYKTVNSEKMLEVYPIPRIMTPKGWRFTFPPKFLNNLTKDSKVFILDDGSWTGETLIQMIDSICFLSVSEILVLSIVARFDDYQREFLSRIQKIKSRHEEIPINIFFGTHLHIPIYTMDSDGCPFIAEENELRKITKLNRHKSIYDYIQLRLKQIRYIDTTIHSNTNDPSSIPKEINKIEILQLRNFIGKYEGYRLYEDDVKEIANYEGDLFGNLDVVTAIILHEPYLIQIIRRLDLKQTALPGLKTYVREIIEGKATTYWDKTSIIRLLSILDIQDMGNFETLKTVYAYCRADKNAVNFLTYFLFKTINLDDETVSLTLKRNMIHSIQQIFNYIKSPEVNVSSEDYIITLKSDEYEAFRQLLNQIRIVPLDDESNIIHASLGLLNVFKQEKTEGASHESLAKSLRSLSTQVYNSLSVLEGEDEIKPKFIWEAEIKPDLEKILKHTTTLYNLDLFKDDKLLINLKELVFGSSEKNSDTFDTKQLSFKDAFLKIDDILSSQLDMELANRLGDLTRFILNKIIYLESIPGIFFLNFTCSFSRIWLSTIKTYERNIEEAGIIINTKNTLIHETDVVSIHKHVLEKIFSNFIWNFIKHLTDYKDVEIILSNDTHFCYLEAIQSQPFNIHQPGGLGISRMETMLHIYGGKLEYPTVAHDESANNMKVKFLIKLPLI